MKNEIWPPPPAEAAPQEEPALVTPPSRPVWKRYGFLLGVASNLAVAVSCVRFFFLPYGSGLDFEDWVFSFVMPLSFFNLIVGSALCLRGMEKQLRSGSSTGLDVVGLVLNWLPYPLAMFLLQEAFTLRHLWDNG